jgi:hypothetical protein
MSTVLDFPDRRAELLRPAILDLLEHMDDTIEIALDRLKRGENPADVLASVYRAAVTHERHGGQRDSEPIAPLAAVLDLRPGPRAGA